MKLLVVALVMLCGCRKEAPSAQRWPEVERLATPLVAGGDGALLDQALERVTMDDVPEVALAEAIAWRKAGGGLPWRGGRDIDYRRPMLAWKLGKTLVERRAEDPEAIHTVLYLGHRLRTEGRGLLDAAMGFQLAQLVVDGKHPTRPELAPTEAEVRRAVAADAVYAMHMVATDPNIDAAMTEQIKGHYAAMIVGAPAERAAFVKHVETMQKKFEKSDVMTVLVTPRLPTLMGEMFATVDAYPR